VELRTELTWKIDHQEESTCRQDKKNTEKKRSSVHKAEFRAKKDRPPRKHQKSSNWRSLRKSCKNAPRKPRNGNTQKTLQKYKLWTIGDWEQEGGEGRREDDMFARTEGSMEKKPAPTIC